MTTFAAIMAGIISLFIMSTVSDFIYKISGIWFWIIWLIVTSIIFIFVEDLLGKIFPGNKVCAWCGGKDIEFLSGKEGKFYWKEANKDGSRDNRFKDNYQLASYTSTYKCLQCNGKTKFGHVESKDPSHSNEVKFRTLLKKGKGERRGEDWK